MHVFRGRVFSVEAGKLTFPNGREHDVAIVRHAPSVVLIPVDDDGRVVLVRQYRAPVDRMTWEFPAGSLDAGESADAAARRECEEEIGRVPERLERLGCLVSHPWLWRRGNDLLPGVRSSRAATRFDRTNRTRTKTSSRVS